MKILRFIPHISLAVLGIIAFIVYKTGSFVNKKVITETALSRDSTSQIGADTAGLTIGQPASEALSAASAIATPLLPTAGVSSTSPATEASAAKQTASLEPEKAKAHETASSKAAVSTSTTAEAAHSSKAQPAKAVAKKDAPKAVTEKAATASPTAETKKGTPAKEAAATTSVKKEIPQEASATPKKENPDARFHVIIGTYSSEANAKTKALAFEQKTKKKASILKYGGYYRVSADDFEFGQAASQYALKLREGGEDNIILKF
jgi:hypothetical protein